MGNVLSKVKREQVIALGRLGWAVRRIEKATGVRRETAGGYLRSAGIEVGSPGGWGRRSKAATAVTTGFCAEIAQSEAAQASASACASYRELIEAELGRGRNIMAAVDRG